MKESETIEFKKSLAELGEGLNSMAAILNKHGGGELWFGIRNDGRPVGMDVSETTLRKVSQAIAAHIEPKIYPEVSKIILTGKSCIRVCFSGSEKPYYSHFFPDRVEVRNPGTLMEGVSLRTLRTAKVSRRRNPLIADLLRRIHLVEAWGRGIPLILDKAPNVRFSQVAGVFITEFPRPATLEDTGEVIPAVTDPVEAPVEAPVELSETEEKILRELEREARGRKDLLVLLGYSQRTGNYKAAIGRLSSLNLIEMTIPDKPNSRLQKYRLTEKGRRMIYER